MISKLALTVLFDSVCAIVCVTSLLRGGRPERFEAMINLTAVALTWALRHWDVEHFAPADVSIFTIDLAVAAGFFWLAVTTIRFWPIWAAGFALCDLFMSVLGGLLPSVPLFAYHTQLGIYAYLALGALAIGTYCLPRNAEPHIRNGSRRSWLQHLKETN
ncbi:apolipoprotein N-acyltransferase [Sphingomonas sp. SORGH_AS 950]|uniref:hypothetical protein n=1 Tax=Sphingomonas sp. SORGH_AS_0950 TaxID=3041792 RepID=UPI002787F4E9|nr:hypothetical protein [Sphingomonas sp. SORGH_AS_0950]MDQ1159519.1 apolipoprotein N-acyltransferase [Sphingomonas sp. SORGH_AS_0950]